MPHNRYAARYAALSKNRLPNDPSVVAAARDLKAHQLERAIERAAATAPELTDAQKSRLAALILADPGAVAASV